MTRYNPLWLQADSYPAAQDRNLLSSLWPTAASLGCAVTASSGMTVSVAPGRVAVPTQNGTGTTLCVSDANEPVTLGSAPASGTNRIDLITCQPRGNDLDGGSNNDFVFTSVAGVVAASPVAPATPAGAVALAQVYVTGGTASIVAANITDVRPHGIGPEVPVAAGAPFASFVDPMGELWVSKGGVVGGVWKKARDALNAKVWRNAAFTTSVTSNTVCPFDTVARDPWGLWVPASNWFSLPVAGIWLISAKWAVAATAIGQYINLNLNVTGALRQYNTGQTSAAANWFSANIVEIQNCVAGDTVQLAHNTSAALSSVAGSEDRCLFEVAYLGRGQN